LGCHHSENDKGKEKWVRRTHGEMRLGAAGYLNKIQENLNNQERREDIAKNRGKRALQKMKRRREKKEEAKNESGLGKD